MELHFARSSVAIDPGTDVAVGTGWTVVLDADDADNAIKFILQNNSDTAVQVRLSSAGSTGITLAAGEMWQEDRYVDVVYARHLGVSGTKALTRVIF